MFKMEPASAGAKPRDMHSFDRPSALHVETTTRCNMRCGMCVKQSPGNLIPEGDLPLEIFKRLDDDLRHADSLVLNGIGEPLLHPDLDAMISFARRRMPEHGRIGFQTNGLLLNRARAESLVRAGLDVICVSVDDVASSRHAEVRNAGPKNAGHGRAPGRAMHALTEAKQKSVRPFSVGVECVLMRDNFTRLPEVVSWAGDHGADFVLVSHMLAYAGETAGRSLFNPNTLEATRQFRHWQRRAKEQGVDLHDYFRVLWKFEKNDAQRLVVNLVRDMQKDAATRGFGMNIRGLLARNEMSREQDELEQVLEQSRGLARRLGLRLELPRTHALLDRRCPFVTGGVAFVDAAGDVAPCHFLWHRYSCTLDGREKQVWPRRFGNIAESSLERIWNDHAFAAFRAEVLRGEYPACSSCNAGPCSDTRSLKGPFQSDCLGSGVPCGHCPWAVGMLKCLDLTAPER